MPNQLPYIPGQLPERPGPLARYLPRLPEGVSAAWLSANLAPGSWVIDPFGAAPRLAVEAAQAGYRILVAANNPIARFLLELAAAPPSADDMQAALAELAASRRGRERMEPHILSLYATQCDNCQLEVIAQAYLWQAGVPGPYARIYSCPHCQHSGEFPATPEDIEKASHYTPGNLHHARALERIAAIDHPDRAHAEEALDAYPPRAVYVLFTLINKLNGLGLTPERHRLLSALLISACDQANTLWPHPTGLPRPRQLRLPRLYRENNIWLALENAVEAWVSPSPAIALTHWPETPPEQGGICLFEGRLKNLADSLPGLGLSAVLTAFPRPNQAFWTLSALWAGWLWGPEALGPFVSVLRRRRYDWAWHTNALQDTLSHLAPHLAIGTPFFGLVTESEAGFDAAVLLAVHLAGFELNGLAQRPTTGQSQFHWQRASNKTADTSKEESATLVQQAAAQILVQRGEPAVYLSLQAAGLRALIANNRIADTHKSAAEIFTQTRAALEMSFTYRSGFLRYTGAESSLESGYWWLRAEPGAQSPLADRVEIALVNELVNSPSSSLAEVDASMCIAFPGLLTPAQELVRTVVESYAQPTQAGGWQIRDTDTPKARRADLQEMRALIAATGERLGYRVEAEPLLRWLEVDGKPIQTFFVIASAVLGEIIFNPHNSPDNSLIVLPGGRAALVLHKLGRDPRLKLAVEQGWRFIKFRHIRRLADNRTLTRQSWGELLGLDPITEDHQQIPLL